jgi:GAF domain-containing protein
MFTFIGRDRAWVKSAAGFPRGSQPRVFAFCSHTICNDGPTVVTNAALDPRFAMHPLVVGEPGVRSYVGVPITAASGTRLGAACLIDVKPRKVTEAVLTNLEEISAIAAAMIDPTPPARLAA